MIIKLDHEEVKVALERGLGKLFREPIRVIEFEGVNPYGNSLTAGIAVTIETNDAPATIKTPYRGEPNVG